MGVSSFATPRPRFANGGSRSSSGPLSVSSPRHRARARPSCRSPAMCPQTPPNTRRVSELSSLPWRNLECGGASVAHGVLLDLLVVRIRTRRCLCPSLFSVPVGTMRRVYGTHGYQVKARHLTAGSPVAPVSSPAAQAPRPVKRSCSKRVMRPVTAPGRGDYKVRTDMLWSAP
jgi:hypothetical protein